MAHKKFIEAHGKKGGWKAHVRKVIGAYETARQLERIAEEIPKV
jgi:hypothetical protein